MKAKLICESFRESLCCLIRRHLKPWTRVIEVNGARHLSPPGRRCLASAFFLPDVAFCGFGGPKLPAPAAAGRSGAPGGGAA